MSADLDAIARRTHHLKCWPEHYENIIADLKPFEVRKDDRFFEVGDILDIHEFTVGVGFSGRSTQRKVLSKLAGGQFGIEPGYCVLGLSRASDAETYNHELDAGKRIIELGKEVAAFKANNRYMRGHTAGYEEAEEKYKQQLAQQSAALVLAREALKMVQDNIVTHENTLQRSAYFSGVETVLIEEAIAQLAEAPRENARDQRIDECPKELADAIADKDAFREYLRHSAANRALTSGEAVEAAEHDQ